MSKKRNPLLSPDWDLNGLPPSREKEEEEEDQEEKPRVRRGPLRFEADAERDRVTFVSPNAKWRPRTIHELSYTPNKTKKVIYTGPTEEAIDEFKSLAREQERHMHRKNHEAKKHELAINAITSTFALGFTTRENVGLLVIALRVDSFEQSGGTLVGEWRTSMPIQDGSLLCFKHGSRVMTIDARKENHGELLSSQFALGGEPPILFTIHVDDMGLVPKWQVVPSSSSSTKKLFFQNVSTIVVAMVETTIMPDDDMAISNVSRSMVYNAK